MSFFRALLNSFSCFVVLVCLLLSACGSGSPDSLNAELGEEFSGGEQGTVFASHRDAFGLPLPNLNFEQGARFRNGNSFFEQMWVEAPASTTARDGLGPTFNARACAVCHASDGRGQPPLSDMETPVSLLFKLSVPGPDGPEPHPDYGVQLQPFANPLIPEEGNVSVACNEIPGSFADGTAYALCEPTYDFFDLAYGNFPAELMISPRVAPQMPGMGLLEALSEEEILAEADPDDQDGDGISGRPNYVFNVETGQEELGRFGWKAAAPTVLQQVAGAFSQDMGLTSSLFPEQNCPDIQLECLAALDGGNPEVQEEILQDVRFYTQSLAVPARRDWEDPEVLQGKQLFQDFGCARCHRPQMQTGDFHPIALLRGQVIRPYTDLLLHDMGPGLADDRPEGQASGSEWRTPPLWGIGLIETVNGHTRLLHDGRARNLSEAILWHGGEAQAAQTEFRNSTAAERTALLRFLSSL